MNEAPSAGLAANKTAGASAMIGIVLQKLACPERLDDSIKGDCIRVHLLLRVLRDSERASGDPRLDPRHRALRWAVLIVVGHALV